jgi:hypothetical protein
VLKDDGEPSARALHGLNGAARPRDRSVDRFLQQHVLPSSGAALHELQVRVGRRQDHRRLDRAVLEYALEVVGHGIAVSGREGLAALGAGRIAGRDLDPVRELLEAPDVRLQGHAEPDDGDAAARAHGIG